MKYSYFEHPSDIGILCRGSSLQELFKNATAALYEIMLDTKLTGETEQKEIIISAEDTAELFAQWVGDIIFYAHAYKLFFKRFDFEIINETEVKAVAHGQIITGDAKLRSEIKGMTYHNYTFTKKKEFWEASFIIDV
ncbi:MAG: hypothetical protein A2Y62_13965 [Candidatus Fischerbacteria bacterium RBG_13_37_8]|uniref:Archease domain-containing protein n=1 Tax=Candidatus Fischerbacteria bacterium RBG_13_37_8 TaxID=1817863 RepID=A0A1F5VH28_9BACT|nr:MAG: hypothetical protein A2Y62_13965 [Candidatus Fischerbacteria bacterium RBG_13_37_8]